MTEIRKPSQKCDKSNLDQLRISFISFFAHPTKPIFYKKRGWCRNMSQGMGLQVTAGLENFPLDQPLGASGGHARHADSSLRPWVIYLV